RLSFHIFCPSAERIPEASAAFVMTGITYAERYILQINALDSSSSVFRYPVNKYGRYHFVKNKYVDARNVGEFFKEISEFLQCVDMMMDDHNQCLADMAAEYADYY
uniref:hypothetical protein n=1 Tax=Blautia obeum TaxID=40520 RepID=UPI001A9AD35C